MLSYLLDSALLIDHFNGIGEATRFLEENHAASAISPITRAEVLTGFDLGRPLDAAPARALIDRFPMLPIDGDIADLAALLRREHRWRLPDAFQAALALRHDLRLVTRDSDDFPPDRHEFVVIPYQLNRCGQPHANGCAAAASARRSRVEAPSG